MIHMLCVPGPAEEGWRTGFERTKDKCIHGASCKAGELCKSQSCVYITYDTVCQQKHI